MLLVSAFAGHAFSAFPGPRLRGDDRGVGTTNRHNAEALPRKPRTMKYQIQPGGTLQGEARVPGDKSISHRSIMLGALANGTKI